MLALWEFFWTEADWAPAPAPVPAPPPGDAAGVSNAGGGGAKRRYQQASQDFWDVRERYLRQHLPKIEGIAKRATVDETNFTNTSEASIVEAVPPGGILLLQQAFQASLLAARAAADRQALREAIGRAQAIALDINNIRQQYYNRAIALLLLDVF